MAEDAIDFEAEYNNRQRVPEHEAIAKRWQEGIEGWLPVAKVDADIAYGPAPRNVYDLYHPAVPEDGAPLVAYIHGGYWQRGDKKAFAFIAKALTDLGCRVAMPSYTLAPEATVMGIVEEMRLFVKALWERTGQHALITGHSAGGQLAAAMLATNWSTVAGVPQDVVRAAMPISGVFELEPLVKTSINRALKLDPESAKVASPLLWPVPRAGLRCAAVVGGAESEEFIRQSVTLSEAWRAAGLVTETNIVPASNHFTVLDAITQPGSLVAERMVSMARAVQRG